jgi:hypothetical protein
MPRYFFHIFENGDFLADEEGRSCPNLNAAKREARASARDMAQQALEQGESPQAACVEIHDAEGRVLGALTVAEVLEHPGHPHFEHSCGTRPDSHRLH